jgi:hypothetical protein
MAYQYNPNDFGPGKVITPEQSTAFLQHNWPKVLIALAMRNPDRTLHITNEDVARMMMIPGGLNLTCHLDERGIHLAVLSDAMAKSLGLKGKPL